MSRNRILGSPYVSRVVTGDTTTDSKVDAYLVDAVPLTITLDPNAFNGDQVLIQDITNAAASNPITVLTSPGQTILNWFGSSLQIATDGGGVQLTFNHDEAGWAPQGMPPTRIGRSVTNPGPLIVDPLNGNDSTGNGTVGSPWRTIMGGVVASWTSRAPILPQTTTIDVIAPETVDQETIVLAPVMANGGNFVLVGTAATVGVPFAAGTVTAKVRGSAGNALQIANMPVAATAGMLIVNTTRGSEALIDAMSGSTATVCQPSQSTVLNAITANVAFTEDDTWTAGDQLQLYKLPLLNMSVLQTIGGNATTKGQASVFCIQRFSVPDVSGTPGTSMMQIAASTPTVFVSCNFDPSLQAASTTAHTSQLYFTNCRLNGGGNIEQAVLAGGSFAASGAAGHANLRVCELDGDIIMHGTQLAVSLFGSYCALGYVFVPNSISVEHGSVMLIEAILCGGACVYGSALDIEAPLAAVENDTHGPWIDCLQMAALTLCEKSTGSTYNAGTWTDGVPITSPNLDTYSAIIDPHTGSRYCNTG